jgi:uncharacterized OB-fold protein
MTSGPPDLTVMRCSVCSHVSLPGDGPCPHCGAQDLRPISVAPQATVIAATELLSVATGWTSPHRLAMVEVPQGVRLLAIVNGNLPAIGSRVDVTMENGLYHVTARLSDPPGGSGQGSRLILP